jgi:hypothetical protein
MYHVGALLLLNLYTLRADYCSAQFGAWLLHLKKGACDNVTAELLGLLPRASLVS